jgi:hypothetical protein
LCTFVIVVLPKHAPLAALNEIARRQHRRFFAQSSSYLQARLRPGEECFRATGAMCDCGTLVGFVARDRSPKQVSYDRKIDGFRARGWSDSRIARWEEQKSAFRDQSARDGAKAEDEAAADAEIIQWRDLIEELLSSGLTPYLGMVVLRDGRGGSRHAASGRREVVRMPDVTAELLIRLDDDVIYEFRPKE